jgi:hypothetical protein
MKEGVGACIGGNVGSVGCTVGNWDGDMPSTQELDPAGELWPSGHAVQEEEAGSEEYVLAGQFTQVAIDSAPTTDEYFPAAHE